MDQYVVLHSAVSDVTGTGHARGTVIASDAFGDDDNVKRLEASGAIRKATKDERDKSKVTLASTDVRRSDIHASLEHRNAELEATLAERNAHIIELTEKLNALHASSDRRKAGVGTTGNAPGEEHLEGMGEAMKRAQAEVPEVNPAAGGEREMVAQERGEKEATAPRAKDVKEATSPDASRPKSEPKSEPKPEKSDK